jgi:hypothetical protein
VPSTGRLTREDFRRQKDLIVDLLAKHFPISVVQHPDFEADDVVYNLVNNSTRAAEFTIVSTDSDFTQMLQEFKNVRLYNPVTKKFVKAPDHDYVLWKSLRGDGSDNIPALVTEKEALMLVNEAESIKDSPLVDAALLERNVELVKLHAWTLEEAAGMRSSSPTRDWDTVRRRFSEWAFQSMLKETYWEAFVNIFDSLWEVSATS